MTDADLRDALVLLDSVLLLLRPHASPHRHRRELRALCLEFDLLRLRCGQPAPHLQRN